jgi:DNA replication protein DnaC
MEKIISLADTYSGDELEAAMKRRIAFKVFGYSQLKSSKEVEGHFDFSFQNSVSQQTLRDLAQLDFLRARENIALLDPPGVGKTHLAVALGIEAVNQGYRVGFVTAQDLADQLYGALADGTVAQAMNKLLRNDLVVLDELGYVQFDATGSDHLFQLIAKAYEYRSLIVTSNLDF